MNTDDGKRDDAKNDEGEPSMEDILASIRRILSDDDKGNEPEEFEDDIPANPERGEALSEDPDNVVEFSTPPPEREMSVPPALEPEPMFAATPDPFDVPGDDNPFDVPPPPPPSRQPLATASNVLELTPQMRLAAEQALMSGPTRDQSTDVLTQLARAILDQRELTVATRQVTLEGMVREMLRPLLREWLDQNLPHLIERLVKQEIDQMVNRAERRQR